MLTSDSAGSVSRAHGSRRIAVLGAAVIVACLAAYGVFAYASPLLSGTSRAQQTGIDYAQQYFVWAHGPTVVSQQTLPLGRLPAALHTAVPPAVGQDINTDQLLQQYGPHRTVALDVLHGTYNSLPPDEGVELTGDVVVLVDVARNKVLLATG